MSPFDTANHSDLHRISKLFQKLLQSDQARLGRGVNARAEMHAIIKSGGDLRNNYRFLWMERSAKESIRFVACLGKTFNDKHNNDKVSVDDMIDVLARAIALLQQAK